MALHSVSIRPAAMAEINITPLIDVLLAIVVVLIVTAPLLTRQITLPLAGASGPPVAVEPVRLRIDAAGTLRWNDAPLPTGLLAEQLRVLAARDPQPALRIVVDRTAAYDVFATVLAAANRAGVHAIAVEDPAH
jgi:biopolymer transport protein ExbD